MRFHPEVQGIYQDHPSADPGRFPDRDMETDLEIESPYKSSEVKDRDYEAPQPPKQMSVDLSARFGDAPKFAGKF